MAYIRWSTELPDGKLSNVYIYEETKLEYPKRVALKFMMSPDYHEEKDDWPEMLEFSLDLNRAKKLALGKVKYHDVMPSQLWRRTTKAERAEIRSIVKTWYEEFIVKRK